MRLYESASAKGWLFLSILFGVGALAIWGYVSFWVSTPETIFGEKWVSVEIALFKLPPGFIPGVPVGIPIQFKPITGFALLSFLWFAAALQSLRGQFDLASPTTRQLIALGAFLLCLVAGYELAWNFSLWSARLAFLGSNPDLSFDEIVDSVAFHSAYYPVNLIFSTKLFASALFIGLYTLYYLHSLEVSTTARHSSR